MYIANSVLQRTPCNMYNANSATSYNTQHVSCKQRTTAYNMQHATCWRRPRATSESRAGKVQGNAPAVATGRGDGAAMQHNAPTLHECFLTWRKQHGATGSAAPLRMDSLRRFTWFQWPMQLRHAGVASHILLVGTCRCRCRMCPSTSGTPKELRLCRSSRWTPSTTWPTQAQTTKTGAYKPGC